MDKSLYCLVEPLKAQIKCLNLQIQQLQNKDGANKIDMYSDWSGKFIGKFFSTFFSNGTTPTYLEFESPIEIVRQQSNTPSWVISLTLPGYGSIVLIAISTYNTDGLPTLNFVSGKLPFSGVALSTKTDYNKKIIKGTVNGIIQVSNSYPATSCFVEFERI